MSEINVLGPQSVSGYLVQYSPIAKMGWLIDLQPHNLKHGSFHFAEIFQEKPRTLQQQRLGVFEGKRRDRGGDRLVSGHFRWQNSSGCCSLPLLHCERLGARSRAPAWTPGFGEEAQWAEGLGLSLPHPPVPRIPRKWEQLPHSRKWRLARKTAS